MKVQNFIFQGQPFYLFRSAKKLCCDPSKCAYTTNCLLDSCTSCAPCSAGQIQYPEISPQPCVADFLNVQYNGKKNWCCNP